MKIIERFLELDENKTSNTEEHFSHNYILKRINNLNKNSHYNNIMINVFSIFILSTILIFIISSFIVKFEKINTISNMFLSGLFLVSLIGLLYVNFEQKKINKDINIEVKKYNKQKNREVSNIKELIYELTLDVKALIKRRDSAEKQYYMIRKEIKTEDLKAFLNTKPKINTKKHEVLNELADYLLAERKKEEKMKQKIIEIEQFESNDGFDSKSEIL